MNITWLVEVLQWFSHEKPTHTTMILFYKSHTGTWQSFQKGRAAYHRAIHFLSRRWVERGINFVEERKFCLCRFRKKNKCSFMWLLSNNIFLKAQWGYFMVVLSCRINNKMSHSYVENNSVVSYFLPNKTKVIYSFA